MEVKIIGEIPADEQGFIYRALKVVSAKKSGFGIEMTYTENGFVHRISMPDIIECESEALDMLKIFAENIVYPHQFTETVWDYVTAKKLEAAR